MEKKSVSKSGVEIYQYKNPSLHGFFISLFLRSGSMYESCEDGGITHFFEHVSIRNINKLMPGGLYSELDKRGIEFNASTYSEMVQFYVSGAMHSFDFAADVITKLFSPIVLDKSEIDVERRRIKAEIRESDERTSLLSFTNSIVHEGTSLSRPITGTLGGVSKINAKRLEAFRREAFSADNIFFYVTGNFTDENIESLISKIDAYDLPRGKKNDNMAPIPERFLNRGGEVRVKGSDFTMVRFTFDLDMSELSVPETDLVYDQLLSGYNSHFFIEMSENRGLFYDLTGAVERYRNMGQLYFSYEVREKDLLPAIEMTVEILKSFKENTLDVGEILKAGYVDNANLLYDDMREFNFTMAYDNHIMCLGYGSLEDRVNAYDSVSAEDIRAAAEKIFKSDNLTLTIKGSKKIDTGSIESIINKL